MNSTGYHSTEFLVGFRMKGFTKDNKFHPIHNTKGVRKARDQTTKEEGVKIEETGSVIGSVLKQALRAPERKFSYDDLLKDITIDTNLRKELINKNDELIKEIESSPTSDFKNSRVERYKENLKILKKVEDGLRKNISRLTDDEKKMLPDDVQTLRRLL